ncbi:MAG: DUF2589 domain-containing protein [Gemmatimonadota bacterium]|nr:DUF2589 domain-containing protein [Gemmatimonadota bacterium]MDE2865057.1 DUF2589 domain-containing protein [Gemmatimonadota bacterium]
MADSYVTKALKSVPLSHLIGGPLCAAVEAQAKAAHSTVEFVNAIGFEADSPDKVRSVTFTYEVTDPEPQQARLTVPILTIIPIPFIRIDEMTIKFVMDVSEQSDTESKSEEESSDKSEVKAEASVGWGPWKASASFSGSYSSSSKDTSSSSLRQSTHATLDITVHAVQDEMPAGLSRVLGILEKSIAESRAPAGEDGTRKAAA